MITLDPVSSAVVVIREITVVKARLVNASMQLARSATGRDYYIWYFK